MAKPEFNLEEFGINRPLLVWETILPLTAESQGLVDKPEDVADFHAHQKAVECVVAGIRAELNDAAIGDLQGAVLVHMPLDPRFVHIFDAHLGTARTLLDEHRFAHATCRKLLVSALAAQTPPAE